METCSLRQRRQRSHRPPAEQESAVSGERSASSQEHSADGTALTSLFLLCRASTVMQKSSLTISCAPSVNLEQISRSLWMCYGNNNTVFTLGLSKWLENEIRVLYFFVFKRQYFSWGGAFVFSPEATRGRIEQNITNTRFFKAIK